MEKIPVMDPAGVANTAAVPSSWAKISVSDLQCTHVVMARAILYGRHRDGVVTRSGRNKSMGLLFPPPPPRKFENCFIHFSSPAGQPQIYHGIILFFFFLFTLDLTKQ